MSRRHTQKLFIKNMVCPRCIRVVGEEFSRLGLDIRSVALGEVVVGGVVSKTVTEDIRRVLGENGFELIEDRRVNMIEKVKHAVLKLVQTDRVKTPIRMKDSEFISKETGFDYHRLSMLFPAVESMTIEQFIILQKIERVKELLRYDQMTLSEIAWTMGYSSVSHVSNQFTKVTGMTPTRFRKMAHAGA